MSTISLMGYQSTVSALRAQGVPEDKIERFAREQWPDEAARQDGLKRPRRGRMNKWEAAYAEHLEQLKATNAIKRWDFEPERFRLATGAYYTPDFRIVYHSSAIGFDEVKGFWREAARVRIKVAAEHNPMYLFRAVTKRSGTWEYETFR